MANVQIVDTVAGSITKTGVPKLIKQLIDQKADKKDAVKSVVLTYDDETKTLSAEFKNQYSADVSTSSVDLTQLMKIKVIPVDTLPAASADTLGVIYLVPKAEAQGDDAKDEYITVYDEATETYSWEKVGDTSVDLTGYATLTDLETSISGVSGYVDSSISAINEAKADKATTLSGYGITDAYTKTEVDDKIAAIDITDTFDTYLNSSTAYNDDQFVITKSLNQFNERIPELPTSSADGVYVLKATMLSGVVSYAWVAENA